MKLKEILEEVIPALGYELVYFEISPAKLIRIFIDNDNQAITISDCEQVSSHLSRLFLVEEIDYNRLEVSSPGLERPLKKLQDFIRFIGKTAKIRIDEPQKKSFQGIIKSVDNSLINLEIDKETISIEFNQISRARLVFETKNRKIKR